MTTAPRWDEIKRLFERCLDCTEEERAAILDAECRDDGALRAEVLRLLAVDTDVLHAAVDGEPGAVLVEESLRQPSSPRQIGEYTIRRIIGEGGMGTVYEAVQRAPERVVALKILRFGLSRERVKRRFEYESQVLARLRHPGIAQVYAAGSHAAEDLGIEIPYFAMEFVEDARPLTSYVRQESLALSETLSLFVRVCAAVQHGHQRGVIHRDLKPANVLVDRAGAAKIIDFGIAHVTEDTAAAAGTLLTQAGDVIGTLQYMSPEQLARDDQGIDSRTDVYALGVILYELLAQRPPFELAGKSITAVARILEDENPAPPSTVGPTVDRELDWIVLRAMAKDRDQRYASASELAADIERFLRHEPVLAGPPGRVYRLRKFVTRNRLAVGASLLFFVALLGFAITTTVLWIRATDAEALAHKEVQQLTEVNTYVRTILGRLSPSLVGHRVHLSDILDRAAEVIDSTYDDRPALSIALRTTIANTWRDLGQASRGLPLAERAAQDARKHLAPDDLTRLRALRALGSLRMATGDLVGAEARLRETLELMQEHLGAEHDETIAATHSLGQALHRQGKYVEAEACLARAAELASALTTVEGMRLAVGSLSGLALTRHERGQADAVDLARQAVDRGRSQLGEDHPTTLTALNNLGTILVHAARPAQAAPILEELVERQIRVEGEESSSTRLTMNNLAAALVEIGRLAEAEKWFRRSLATEPNPESHLTLIKWNNLGRLLEQQEKWAAALAIHERNLGQLEALVTAGKFPRGHWLRAVFQKGRGVCLFRLGRHAAAEKELRASLVLMEATSANRVPKVLQALVELYTDWGRPEDAAKYRARLPKKDG